MADTITFRYTITPVVGGYIVSFGSSDFGTGGITGVMTNREDVIRILLGDLESSILSRVPLEVPQAFALAKTD